MIMGRIRQVCSARKIFIASVLVAAVVVWGLVVIGNHSETCIVKTSENEDFLSKEFFGNQLLALKSGVATVADNFVTNAESYFPKFVCDYMRLVENVIFNTLCDSHIDEEECKNLGRTYYDFKTYNNNNETEAYNSRYNNKCEYNCLDTNKFVNSDGECVECPEEGTFPLKLNFISLKEDGMTNKREEMTCSTFDESKCYGEQFQVKNAAGELELFCSGKPECHSVCNISYGKKCVIDRSCPNGMHLKTGISTSIVWCEGAPDKSSCVDDDIECKGECPEGTLLKGAFCKGLFRSTLCEENSPMAYILKY